MGWCSVANRERILEIIRKRPSITQAELAREIGISQPTISSGLRMLGAVRGTYAWYVPQCGWKKIYLALEKSKLGIEADGLYTAITPPGGEQCQDGDSSIDQPTEQE